MICVIALIVFGLMAVFSAAYRPLAREAFDCVFRKATFRKCRTNLDERLKSGITGRLMGSSPKIGAFVYKRFEILSWVFVILTVASLVFAADGLYNYAVHGNCNGPDSNNACIYGEVFSEEKEGCIGCDDENCDCSLEECKNCEQCLYTPVA